MSKVLKAPRPELCFEMAALVDWILSRYDLGSCNMSIRNYTLPIHEQWESVGSVVRAKVECEQP